MLLDVAPLFMNVPAIETIDFICGEAKDMLTTTTELKKLLNLLKSPRDDSQINMLEYFKAALHTFALNNTESTGSLRCILWLTIKLKNDEEYIPNDDGQIISPLEDDEFCEAIIRQENKKLIRFTLPKPENSDRLKLRWPLNDLEVTDTIKYVDLRNLPHILSTPFSAIKKLEVSLSVLICLHNNKKKNNVSMLISDQEVEQFNLLAC
ncbi:unnamed protein product [Trichobilharzia regenti]|nr:unnamed protein product [Trichobilharzia regenti]